MSRGGNYIKKKSWCWWTHWRKLLFSITPSSQHSDANRRRGWLVYWRLNHFCRNVFSFSPAACLQKQKSKKLSGEKSFLWINEMDHEATINNVIYWINIKALRRSFGCLIACNEVSEWKCRGKCRGRGRIMKHKFWLALCNENLFVGLNSHTK